MVEKELEFRSDGLKIDASFYLPEGGKDVKGPDLLICSGFMGLKNIHPERFARFLTPQGYRCFSFDYRGFAKSQGDEVQVYLEEQCRDILNAAHLLVADQQKAGESRGLVLIGWGMAGGLVLNVAAQLKEHLKGLICMNGFYDGERFLKNGHGEHWSKFMAWAQDERIGQLQNDQVKTYDPFTIYPLDPVTKGYVDGVLRKNKDFGGRVSLGFFDSIFNFKPESKVQSLLDIPLLIAHGEKNKLHSAEEASALQKVYPGKKEVYWIKDGGHTEWMQDEDEKFQKLVTHMQRWLEAA